MRSGPDIDRSASAIVVFTIANSPFRFLNRPLRRFSFPADIRQQLSMNRYSPTEVDWFVYVSGLSLRFKELFKLAAKDG
jgi:hypothetical protein